MSQKKSEHIINYILRKTDERNKNSSQRKEYKKTQYSLDNTIFYCKQCEMVWSNVPYWVDVRKYVNYPKNIVPTIGKKRKICNECRR
mgnify:CR=1 FL=1